MTRIIPNRLSYVVIEVECTRCHHKQKVEVYEREKRAEMVEESVVCDVCKIPYNVMLPDKIVEGRFISG
jgi:uncharacterized CHY-type Zn-finger protein